MVNMLNSSLNLSLEAFAYQKKPSVLAIHDSDDDLDVQCLDDEIPGMAFKGGIVFTSSR